MKISKLLLTYASFVIGCLVVIAAFITATTYIQLAVAILLYPVLVFFAYKVLPIKSKTVEVEALQGVSPSLSAPVEKSIEPVNDAKRDSVGISDIDKRVFLKLIGGAGVFLFLFSLFNKKAEGLFFKNLPGSVSGVVSLQDTTGKKIDPAQNQPMDGYRICEFDDNVVSFYGFINKDGAWIVMKVDTNTGSFRYAKGDTNFPGSWTNRQGLSYDYYSNVF